MTRSRAPYMEWARSRPAARYDLVGSNLLACRLSDLPGARDAVDLAGESPYGYAPLIEAIAAHHGVGAERVSLANGCSGANFLSCAALLDSGDELLIEEPHYDPIPAAAKMVGARVTTFRRRFEDGWQIDPDRVAAAVTTRTRLIAISSPHNPTGVLSSPDRLEALARLAERAGIHVLVDEVYRDVVLPRRPRPAASLSPVFVSTSSLTKAYGLSSLRCGWVLASPEMTRAIRRAQDVMGVYGAVPAERLAKVAFDHIDRLAERARGIVANNVDIVGRFLKERHDLECVFPDATLAFPRLRGASDTTELARRLFERYATAIAPGSFFGAPEHFRLAFGGAAETVEKGLAALAACLDEFQSTVER